jgi:hypothetical protein
MPTRRKTVRLNSKLTVEEDFAMEDVYQHGRLQETEWLLEQNGINENRMEGLLK